MSPDRRRPVRSSPRSRLLQGRTRLWGRLLLLLLPFLLLAAVEGILRLAGVAADEPLLLRHASGGIELFQVNPEIGRRYFPRDMERIMPKPGFRLFPVRKEPGQIRIFVLGESSAAGFPYHTHGSFSGFLEDRLRVLWPGRQVDVVNCAMTAINSYAVLDFVKELKQAQPDLFMLYLGHNEYYGALGAASRASFGAGPGAVRALRWFLELRLLRVARSATEGIFKSPERVQGKTVMEAMVGRTGIRRGDRVDRAAIEGFERNLRAILEAAGSTPVLLCQVASNLRDLPPFESVHTVGMPREGAAEFDRVLGEARAALAAGRPEGARPQLYRALSLDSTYAEAHFLFARVLEAAGDRSGALREYRSAREHDGIPFRAPSAINAALERTARDSGQPLLRTEELFVKRSSTGIPGADLFFEHVHPRLNGQQLIAEGVISLLFERGVPVPREQWHPEADRGPGDYLLISGITPLDEELADQRIFHLTHKWPFPEKTGETYASKRDPLVVETARSVLEHRFDLAEAHARLGKALAERGDLEPAFFEYRTVCKIYPVEAEYFAAAGQILLRLGRADEGLRYLEQAISLDPREGGYRRLLEEARRSSRPAGRP